MNMTRKDTLLLGGSIAVSLVAGVAAAGIQSVQTIAMITLGLTVLAGITVLYALFGIYRGRKPYGGEVARALEIIGIGFGLFIITYLPHVVWHIFGLQAGTPLGPSWNFSPAWWAGFFHIGAIMFFLMATYGFYRFAKLE